MTQDILILKALTYFLENPYEEIYLREFSRKLKISPNTAQRFLNQFLKENLIIEERKANLRYFTANTNNILFRQMKITHSINKIQKSKILNELKDFTSVTLFGSMAKGIDDKNSDIDILCIGNKKINKEKIQEKIDKELNIHIFTRVEWKKQMKNNKAFYQDIITDGIKLIGEVPIIE